MGDKRSPPHRWFLIGPKRSGSEVHIDPLATSAWNTSIQGRKRWVLFPPAPDLTKKFVRGAHLAKPGEDDEAIQYFDLILPRLKTAEGPSGSGKLSEIIECVQHPGETMFVPGNWWHGVLNLDFTIAITQNICNHGNFEKVWKSLRKGRKRLTVNFLRKLEKAHPDLYAKAIEMNEKDNFVMWNERKEFQKYFGDDCSSSSISSSSSSSSFISSDAGSRPSSPDSSSSDDVEKPATKRQKTD